MIVVWVLTAFAMVIAIGLTYDLLKWMKEHEARARYVNGLHERQNAILVVQIFEDLKEWATWPEDE
jgi:hypothetical protein